LLFVICILLATFTLQYFVFRHQIAHAAWWVLATTIGLFSALVTIKLIDHTLIANMSSNVVQLGGCMIIGAGMGTGQWIILRASHSHTYWWILSSAVGWALAYLVIQNGSVALLLPGLGVVASLGYSVITALTLYFLFKPKRLLKASEMEWFDRDDVDAVLLHSFLLVVCLFIIIRLGLLNTPAG
jgi:hypothetical protein